MAQHLHTLKKLNNLFLLLFSFYVTAQNMEWAKQIGGNVNQESLDVTLDAVGNIYTTGWFDGTVDFDPSASTYNLTATGSRDVFISKLDSSGNFIWAKRFGASGYDQAYSIHIDNSGNIYTTGWFQNTVDFDPGLAEFNITSNGGFDVFVLKLDANGDFVWAKNLGGSSHDIGYSVVGNEHGVYLSGRFQGTADFDPGASAYNLTAVGLIDAFTVKLSTTGNFEWAQQYGTTGANIGEAVDVDTAGNIYTLVRFKGTVDFDASAAVFNLTSFGADDMAIVKLSTNGNLIWAKQMGGSGTEEPTEMVLDASGNIYTTGYFSGIADFDPGANQNTLTSKGSFDVFISKLDSNGSFVWAKQIGGTGSDDGKGLDVDNLGNVYASGIFNGTLDADPSTNVFSMTAYGDNDVYVVKLDSNGDFVWGTHFGGIENDLGRAIAVNETTFDVFVTGTFESVSDFDSGATETTLTSFGGTDVFIAKLSDSTLSTTQILNNLNLILFPNPTANHLYIKSNLLINASVQIVDITGRIMQSWQLKTRSHTSVLDVSFLPAGTYILNFKTDSSSFSKKLSKL